jgi:hypothetical protein
MDRTNSSAAGPRRGREPEAFDRWLHKQLHELYGAIASEPLPADLIALIDHPAAEPSSRCRVECSDTP